MKVSIAAKRIVILLMTMALAVALVACSGAAGTPGPAGPPGEQGPPGTPAEPSGEPGEPPIIDSPVAIIDTAPHIFRFNDAEDGTYDKSEKSVDVRPFFHPSTGLEYTVGGASDAKKYLTIGGPMDGMLTVMFMKEDKAYMNHTFNVKAMSPTNMTSKTKPIHVRRNRAPMMGGRSELGEPDATDSTGYVWVTGEEKVIKAMEAEGGSNGGTDDAATDVIYIGFGVADDASNDNDKWDNSYFVDDPMNKLKFMPADMTSKQRTMLMVTGGDTVTLVGKGTTLIDSTDDATDNATEQSFLVKLIAEDDGMMATEDPKGVFWVRIDTPPKPKGELGLLVLTLGDPDTESRTYLDVGDHFMDDRDIGSLTFSVSSDNENVAVGMITAESDTADEDNLMITAKNRGMATITLTAKEPMGAATADSAMSAQSAVQTIMVEVK